MQPNRLSIVIDIVRVWIESFLGKREMFKVKALSRQLSVQVFLSRLS